MPLGFLLKAVKGIDFDSDELYKSPLHAAFIKNIGIEPNDNPSVQGGVEGDNSGVFTPTEATVEVPLALPEGDNYCIGVKEVAELNELYVFVFNTKKNHCIYRINGHDSSVQMVKIDPDFNFQLDPRYYIPWTRCSVRSYCYYNKATNQEERRKEMYFTDNFNPMRYLNIEDCIATNGFDQNKYPFFKFLKPYNEYLINNGLPYPTQCIGIKPIPIADADKIRDNRINNAQFKFRIKWIDVWGRESEHGVISVPYKNGGGGGSCFSASLSRCLELSIYAGPPTIDKIQIEVSTCSGNAQNLTVESDWSIYEIIDKYDQDAANKQWWERPINPDITYDAATNIFKYIFCNDKGCKAIPVSETNRRFNPIPITTGCVFPLNKSIGVANNRKKYPPLSKTILNSVNFTVDKPTSTSICVPKPINITLYAILYCEQEKRAVHFIKDGDYAIFGADKFEFIKEAGQILPKGQEGIIGYFAGTEEYAISKQYQMNRLTGEMVEVGLDYLKDVPFLERSKYVAVQKWEFKNLMPGTRIFRMASHQASPSDEYQKTSTNVYGLTYLDNDRLLKLRDINVRELVIDACDKDLDLKDSPFLIVDITRDGGRITNAISGYLYEDEVNKIPIENARIDSTEFSVHPPTTDHNGYFWSVNRKKGWKINLYGTKNGKTNQFLIDTQETYDAPGSRYRHKNVFAFSGNVEYPSNNRVLIKGKVVVCGTSNGVSGVPVLITNARPGVTDANGNFTLVAHDRGDGSNEARTIIIIQGGKCTFTTCDGKCGYCFPKKQANLPAPGPNNREVSVGSYEVNVVSQTLQGPQNGGRYELGIVAFDWLGRTNGVENLEKHFVDIPTIQETGIFGYSQIKYRFSPSPFLTFPSWVKRVAIVIGRNLNWDDFLTWYADKIELIDNSGLKNTVNPTQIKIYYRGMVEYNKKNNLATNTNWQFFDTEGKLIQGDRVEFIANGDGKVFTERISSLVKADKDGTYFTIDYDEKLKGLKDGAMIKIIRPRTCLPTNIFYEVCQEILLENNKIPSGKLSGTLDYVDSYMVNRQIPIPFIREDGTQDETRTITKNLAFPFEHHSPSDFWGDHCNSRGRGFTKDPYATIQCLSTEIGVSKALVNDGLINGLSYFDDADFKEFDKQEWGSITAVVPFIGGMLVICEQNNFVVGFDENTVRAAGDGRLIAQPANERFGRPDRKIGSKYGCQPYDINTIAAMEGIVTWLDSSKSAWVLSNYQQADNMALAGCAGWIKDKIKHVVEYNATNTQFRKFFHAGFDPRSNQVLLTSFRLPVFNATAMAKPTIKDYVNELRHVDIERNETLGIFPFGEEVIVKQMYSCTPEYFATLVGHHLDKQLFSFKGAVPHRHHTKYKRQTKYLSFYGVTCDWVYEVIMNIDPKKVKRFTNTEVYCKQQLVFCDRITTQTGQESRLMISAFENREHFYVADFRSNVNTHADPNSEGLKDPARLIFEGDALYGTWLKARYVGYPKQNGRYFEFDGVSIGVFGSEKSGTNNK